MKGWDFYITGAGLFVRRRKDFPVPQKEPLDKHPDRIEILGLRFVRLLLIEIQNRLCAASS